MSAKDKWDKADIIAKIVATLLIPIALAGIALYSNHIIRQREEAQKDKELKLKNIEIAINILSSNPTADNQSLRDWAINTINANSDIKLSSAAIKVLKEKPLPRRPNIYKESPISIIDGKAILTETGDVVTTESGQVLTTGDANVLIHESSKTTK